MSVDALAAGVVLVLFCVAPGMNRFFAARVADMVHGTAYKPYAYRALVPFVARCVVGAIPRSVKTALVEAAANNHALHAMFTAAGYPSESAPECVVATALVYASFIAFLVTMRRALCAFYEVSPIVKRLMPVIWLLIVPMCFGYASFMYDGSTLFFAAAGLLLIAREKWSHYLALFTIALFNKETASLLLVPFVASQVATMPRAKFTMFLAYQLAAVAFSRVILHALFGRNRGEYFLLQLTTHNLELLQGPRVAKLVFCIVLAALVAWGWRSKPLLLRWSMLMLVPLVVACALYGYLDELRAYYDVYPVVALLAAPSVARLVFPRGGLSAAPTRCAS